MSYRADFANLFCNNINRMQLKFVKEPFRNVFALHTLLKCRVLAVRTLLVSHRLNWCLFQISENILSPGLDVFSWLPCFYPIWARSYNASVLMRSQNRAGDCKQRVKYAAFWQLWRPAASAECGSTALYKIDSSVTTSAPPITAVFRLASLGEAHPPSPPRWHHRCNMEQDQELNPDTDDLPLRANTSHILVRHYVLDLTVHFERRVIAGSAVLFLEPGPAASGVGPPRASPVLASPPGAAHAETLQASPGWQTTSDGDFTLMLDCCDLSVSKVEEVDLPAALVHDLIATPSSRWRQKFEAFADSSRAPAPPGGASLEFFRDRWSLQVRKKGIASSVWFPRAIRICYETQPVGGSVRWTTDQDNRLVQRTRDSHCFCYGRGIRT